MDKWFKEIFEFGGISFVSLESREAVVEAHRWLVRLGKELGATGLCKPETNGPVFIFGERPGGK